MNHNWISSQDHSKQDQTTQSIMSFESPIKENIIKRRNEGIENGESLFIDNYIIMKKLGSGAFAEVYLAKHIDGGYVAFKIEDTNKMMKVRDEYRIYKYLRSKKFTIGLPKVYDFIETEDYNIIAMQLLGLSLEDQFKNHNKQFKLQTVLKLGVDILTLMNNLHSNNFIHRDIKPHNFMLSKDSSQVLIVDFGLSKKYRSRTGSHIDFNNDKNLVGTTRYVSVNIHNRLEPSRRDDLESIGYMLIYFLKGSLPWQGLKKEKGKSLIKLVGDKKKSTPINSLCSDIPQCFEDYLIYCRSLKFDETPDYEMLQNLFIITAKKLNINLHYEWI